MNPHKLIRDQLTQLLLGESLDMPISAVMEHLCQCAECKAYAVQMEETLGRLPEALPMQVPPPELRSTVLAAVRQEQVAASVSAVGFGDAGEGDGDHQADGQVDRTSGEQRSRRLQNEDRRWYHVLRQPLVASLAVALIGLTLGNVSLIRNGATKDRELAVLTEQYNADTRWLEHAEYILVEGEDPQVRQQLVPTDLEPFAEGQAVVYFAYGDTYYLLVQVRGLEPLSTYEIWLQNEGERAQIGSLITSGEGDDVWVYRSTEGMITGRLGVRREGAAGPSVVADL